MKIEKKKKAVKANATARIQSCSRGVIAQTIIKKIKKKRMIQYYLLKKNLKKKKKIVTADIWVLVR